MFKLQAKSVKMRFVNTFHNLIRNGITGAERLPGRQRTVCKQTFKEFNGNVLPTFII